MSGNLGRVRKRTTWLNIARTKEAVAEREWRESIRQALVEGERAADIAEAAGISKARVYQIRDGRR